MRDYEVANQAPEPIATEALACVAALDEVRGGVRTYSAEERPAARQARGRAIVVALGSWLKEKLDLVCQKSKPAEPIRYVLSDWQDLSPLLDDRRVEGDSNTVERSIRQFGGSITRMRYMRYQRTLGGAPGSGHLRFPDQARFQDIADISIGASRDRR